MVPRLAWSAQRVRSFAACDILSSGRWTSTAAPSNGATTGGREIGRFAIDQPAPGTLILDGQVNGQKLRMETSYFDPANLRLVSATFKWVQDRPWNISNADYVSQLLR
jgi:hypothetical protein